MSCSVASRDRGWIICFSEAEFSTACKNNGTFYNRIMQESFLAFIKEVLVVITGLFYVPNKMMCDRPLIQFYIHRFSTASLLDNNKCRCTSSPLIADAVFSAVCLCSAPGCNNWPCDSCLRFEWGLFPRGKWSFVGQECSAASLKGLISSQRHEWRLQFMIAV